MFFWYGPLASLSLQIASVASEHHDKNNGGSNQWITRVKITPQVLKIHLSFLLKVGRRGNIRISASQNLPESNKKSYRAGDVVKDTVKSSNSQMTFIQLKVSRVT